MRIAVTGSSGLAGSALLSALAGSGHRVIKLVRRGGTGKDQVLWDPEAWTIDAVALRGIEAFVHLAGEPINGRWTPERKTRIRESRVRGTRLIARTVAGLDPRPRVLVCASAMGYYGDRADEALTEESPPGRGFLADVAVQWEAAAQSARDAGVRVVSARFGLIMAPKGGALGPLKRVFQTGLGGKTGTGRQWWPWIAVEDAAAAIRFVIEHDEISGPVNVVSPRMTTNAEFARTLARVVSRPAVLTVPAWAVKLLLGESGKELLLYSQRMAPRKLQDAGFQWLLPDLEAALRRQLRPRPSEEG